MEYEFGKIPGYFPVPEIIKNKKGYWVFVCTVCGNLEVKMKLH